MNGEPMYVAIDVGAGFGAKIGLFSSPANQFGEDLLPREEFADNIDDLVARLVEKIRQLVRQSGRRINETLAIGIASPGLFRSDGSYLLAANLTFLNGQNLRARLAAEMGVPTMIENDANAGAWRSGPSCARTCCTGSSAEAGAGFGSTRKGPSSSQRWTGMGTTGSCTTPMSRATRPS